MSRFLSPRRRGIMLLVLVLGAATAIILLSTPHPAAAINCGQGSYPSVLVTYYSGPKHEKEVGQWQCGNLTGEATNFFTERPICCPSGSNERSPHSGS
jgi:hypothetical protein